MLNFKVNANETVAFVGKTGAGKTTITNLINRFYEVKDLWEKEEPPIKRVNRKVYEIKRACFDELLNSQRDNFKTQKKREFSRSSRRELRQLNKSASGFVILLRSDIAYRQ